MDSLPNLQRSCNTLHRHSISQSPVLSPPPPYVDPPPYPSLADYSAAHWWETGAKDILRGTDLYAIHLICRFQTYRNRSDPGSILLTRWAPILDSFLLRLRPGHRATVVDLDKDQKVEEILKLLIPSLPPSDHLEDWPPFEVFNKPDTSRAALSLRMQATPISRKCPSLIGLEQHVILKITWILWRIPLTGTTALVSFYASV